MPEIIEVLLLAAFVIWFLNWLYKKWKKLDLEAKQNEIKEIESRYKTVGEIEKNFPDYKKKKEYVEKFTK
jgi:Tfp pilus assembly protein PilO